MGCAFRIFKPHGNAVQSVISSYAVFINDMWAQNHFTMGHVTSKL